MKRNIFKRLSIAIIIFVMFATVIYGIAIILTVNTFAQSNVISKDIFRGIDDSPNGGNALYNTTNTYNYYGNNTSLDREYVYYNTSIDGRNSNQVSTSSPLITVLTHGLGGNASHWSNGFNSKFAYDKDSLFTRLSDEFLKNGEGGSVIYWAKMYTPNSFYLYDLNNPNNIDSNKVYQETETVSSISDISKHIIIIFEAKEDDEYNFKVYEEFNYMLSKIVYDVKLLNGDVLPKINLIGHSRGGIINLMYALDHPEMVASIFSMGTPYFGSDTASTNLGASVAGLSNGLDDIIDRNVYFDYFNRWENDLNRLYSGIDVYALGGYSDSDFVLDALIESTLPLIEQKITDEALIAIKWAIKSSGETVAFLNGTAEITDFLVSVLRNENYTESEFESYVQIIADLQYYNKDENMGFWENLWDNIVHNLRFVGCPYFMNDLLVDLTSQIGFDEHSDIYRDYGFNVYTKCFRQTDYENGQPKKLSSSTMPAVVHNLEARDSDLIDYILTNISLGANYSGYLYNKTSATTATLTGYRGSLLAGEVELPAQLDGLTIDRVASDIFKGIGGSITSLSIPATVKYIDDDAFIGMKNLSTVEFAEENNITTIGHGAFAGCVNLKNFMIPKNITKINDDVFLGCKNLTNLTVETGNTSYAVIDGVLFDSSGTELIYYPNGKTNSEYTIPLAVTNIGAYAFCFNERLEKVHIYGTPYIDDFAFFECMNLDKVYFYSLIVPELGSCVFLNNVFTLYVPYSKQNIYQTAFSGYTQNIDSIPIVVTLKIDGEIYQTLNTYYGATIAGIDEPYKEGYTFNYWKDVQDNEYQNGDVWNITKNLTVTADWTARQFYITFNGYGSDELTAKLVTYDQPIGELPSLNRTGYTFNGWKDEYNQYYNDEVVWQRTSNLMLTSDFSVNEYTITYNANGGNSSVATQQVVYGNIINNFATASKIGYTFTNWNTRADGSGETIVAPYTFNEANDIILYAQYTANTYVVTFDKQGGSNGSNGVNAIYNSAMPTAIAPSKTGYTFNGYYSQPNGNGTQYYNSNMISAHIWDNAAATTLYANWTANAYTVTFDKQGGSGGTNSVSAIYSLAMPNAMAPSKIGYAFVGYYTGQNGSGTQFYDSNMNSVNNWNIAVNTTLYAKWTANVYTVTLNKQSNVLSGTDTVDATYGSAMPSATAPTRTGYIFKGYYTGTYGTGVQYYKADMSSARSWNIASDKTLYAYWVGNNYTVTLNKQGGSGGTSSVTATYGSAMPYATAPTRTGYTFIGYYAEMNGAGAKYYDGPNMVSVKNWDFLSNTTTLYAYWEKTEYTITLVINDNSTDETTVYYGDKVVADFAPYRQHYEFKGYYTQPNGQGTCYVEGVVTKYGDSLYGMEPESTDARWYQESNGILYAYWERIQAIIECSVLSIDDTTLSPTSVYIISGQPTTIVAPNIDGYTFDHWTINGQTYNTVSVTETFELHRSFVTGKITIFNPNYSGSATYSDGLISIAYTKNPPEPSCVAAGTLITLADGSQVPVETLTGNERLLVWNLQTGCFDSAPILFMDSDPATVYTIINLFFADGTHVKVIDEHAFWDINLNRYVFMRADASQYIGHYFNKQITNVNDSKAWASVQLTNVTITQEYTTAWSPVTYGHLCYYVNGMLSMPGATEGLINIFEVDSEMMKINETQFNEDIETYGLFTYEEFAAIFPIPETIFEAFELKYFKVSVGKGLITYEQLGKLIERYSEFF